VYYKPSSGAGDPGTSVNSGALGDDSNPSLSLDDSWTSFAIQDSAVGIYATNHVFKAPSTGGSATLIKVAGGPFDDLHPDWGGTPGDEWIAFASSRNGTIGAQYSIWIMRPDGTQKQQVTDSGHLDLYPSWSPDGQKIAFSSNRSGSTQLWVVSRS